MAPTISRAAPTPQYGFRTAAHPGAPVASAAEETEPRPSTTAEEEHHGSFAALMPRDVVVEAVKARITEE